MMSSYFSFASQIYEEIDGIAIRAPSPVITNFFMEDFEEMALNRPAHKPLCWFHCVPTFHGVTVPHKAEELP